MTRATWVPLAALCALAACKQERELPARAPTYVNDVQDTLEQQCVECHGPDDPGGGYRLDSYWAALGCTLEGQAAVQPEGEQAPLVAVLDEESHQGIGSEDTRETLLAWVREATPESRPTVHAAGVMNPRAEGWHGALAAQRAWGPLRDADDDLACGRCHEGAPVGPEDVSSPAPAATACTSCHTGDAGALDCRTCHGDGETRSYPPRDACYFEPALEGGAHAAHLDTLTARLEPYDCTACHPTPDGDALFDGSHANGALEVAFDETLAGESARYDGDAGTCAVGCHARGGEVAEPAWAASAMDEPLDCNGCHLSPPVEHYAGPCGTCHAEMGAAPDSLTPGPLHLNGTVDVGDGGGSCGSCHGSDESGWPEDAPHAAHRDQSIAEPLECAECHRVPADLDSPGHLDGRVDVVLSGRADRAGLDPSYSEDGSCSEVACHAAWLRDPAPEPVWTDDTDADCGFCHGAPPPAPHSADDGCSSLLCHGSMVAEWPDGPRITEPGRTRHLDGML